LQPLITQGQSALLFLSPSPRFAIGSAVTAVYRQPQPCRLGISNSLNALPNNFGLDFLLALHQRATIKSDANRVSGMEVKPNFIEILCAGDGFNGSNSPSLT